MTAVIRFYNVVSVFVPLAFAAGLIHFVGLDEAQRIVLRVLLPL